MSAERRELYSILGVSPEASQKEIENAYRMRARILHPDRFDQDTQAADLRIANAMMAELNAAYSVLREAEKRAQYDAERGPRSESQRNGAREKKSQPKEASEARDTNQFAEEPSALDRYGSVLDEAIGRWCRLVAACTRNSLEKVGNHGTKYPYVWFAGLAAR